MIAGPSRLPGGRIDLPGTLAATLGTGAVIYGLVEAGSGGWGAANTVLPPAAGLLLGGVFVAVERVARQPLVPLRLLARRRLVAGQLVMLAGAGLLIALVVLSSLVRQRLLGYTSVWPG